MEIFYLICLGIVFIFLGVKMLIYAAEKPLARINIEWIATHVFSGLVLCTFAIHCFIFIFTQDRYKIVENTDNNTVIETNKDYSTPIVNFDNDTTDKLGSSDTLFIYIKEGETYVISIL